MNKKSNYRYVAYDAANREDAELALATIKNEIEAREKGKVL
jgi:hypothetical protein